MLYAAYCRVSTEEQAKGDNIQAQIYNISEYCSRNSISIPNDKWYLDDGFSGAERMRDRPAGNRLLLDVLEGKITHVLVWKVDRLARDDFIAQEIYKTLKSAGVFLISITEQFDYFKPEGQLMASTFASFAAYDRATIRCRFAEGKAQRAREGFLPQGLVPYGYKSEKRKAVELNLKQAEIIKLIFKLYTEDSMSHREIAEYLTSLSVPTPAASKSKLHSASPAWCVFSVSKILKSGYYATGKYPYKPPGKERIMVPVPTIIDIDTFTKASNIAIAKKKDCPAPGTYRNYLLRGLIRCGICGSTYTGTSSGKGSFFYYRCNKRKKMEEGKCTATPLPALWLEQVIWDNICELFANPDKLTKKVSEILAANTSSSNSCEQELSGIQTAKVRLDQEKQRLLDAVAKGLISESDIKSAIEKRNQEINTLTEREKVLNDKIISQEQHTKLALELKDIANEIQDIIANADDDTKSELFHMLIDHIEVIPTEDPKVPKIQVFYKINLNLRNDCFLVK